MDTGYLIYFRKIKKKLILNFYLNVICFENEHWARVKINHMPCIWITNNLFKRNKLKIVVITCVLSEGRYIIRFLNLENKKKKSIFNVWKLLWNQMDNCVCTWIDILIVYCSVWKKNLNCVDAVRDINDKKKII